MNMWYGKLLYFLSGGFTFFSFNKCLSFRVWVRGRWLLERQIFLWSICSCDFVWWVSFLDLWPWEFSAPILFSCLITASRCSSDSGTGVSLASLGAGLDGGPETRCSSAILVTNVNLSGLNSDFLYWRKSGDPVCRRWKWSTGCLKGSFLRYSPGVPKPRLTV